MLAALLLAPLLAGATPDPLLIDRQPEARPGLLVLGSPHLANSNRDVVNTRIGDITTPDRQREIAALVDRLAAFRPTRIAIEWPSARQDRLDARYAAYRDGTAPLKPDEREQIGFRLAKQLGLARIDAVDWNGRPAGSEADWDYSAWAEANGMGPRFAAMKAGAQAEVDMDEAFMACTAIGDWYRRYNQPEARARNNRRYYDFAMLGAGETNPGATWVGSWYGRNLRILANLVRLAPAATDRVLVLYGSGHAFLLDQFARQSGAFAVADTLAYLPPPAARRC
ncbi:DUF5694 domain-containing protein [Sphingomonas naphthae]|uniref:DUF5694 domain-containing protein n=1 Tax=Sphingomonas naphthae TaxID=1813468 RepID=A0ABY7TFL4_9SPHN|nr:DUF5694 domain-containing protein [Sphingomonas naphthae]WCT72003.1 DUF5694 domain-containing protein [Sphingomonas naphthae]